MFFQMTLWPLMLMMNSYKSDLKTNVDFSPFHIKLQISYSYYSFVHTTYQI